MKNNENLNLIEFFETDNNSGFRHIIKKDNSFYGVSFNGDGSFVMTESNTEHDVRNNLNHLTKLNNVYIKMISSHLECENKNDIFNN